MRRFQLIVGLICCCEGEGAGGPGQAAQGGQGQQRGKYRTNSENIEQ